MSYGRREAVMAVPPERAARAIRRALRRGPSTVYVPARWRWIMLAIRSIPDSLFRRLDL
jgi:short-subunit dehydrogenase